MNTPKQEYERQVKEATMIIEYPRRRQIFDESVSIIQKTNNPDVLFRRYDLLTEFVQWAFELKKNGFPIKIEETEEDMRIKLQTFYNFHCVRIAKFMGENAPKSKRFQTLLDLQKSLKSASNKESSFIEIAQIINKTILL